MKHITLFVCFFLLVAARLVGQCTRSAGTLVPYHKHLCTLSWGDVDTVHITHLNDAILDTNDVLRFVLFEGTVCDPASAIYATDTNWLKPPYALDITKQYGIAAVVGNKSTVPGIID